MHCDVQHTCQKADSHIHGTLRTSSGIDKGGILAIHAFAYLFCLVSSSPSIIFLLDVNYYFTDNIEEPWIEATPKIKSQLQPHSYRPSDELSNMDRI
jgi:hypothetical protein